MKHLIIALLTITCFGLSNCNLFKEPKPEPKTNKTFYWEGTLYKGLGEEVWPNANLELTGYKPPGTLLPENHEHIEVLSTATTDSDGHFFLEYSVDSNDIVYDESDGGYISLNANGGNSFLDAPWNVNVNRQICEIPHVDFTIFIQDNRNDKTSDTLFIGGHLIGTNHLIDGNVQTITYINENNVNSSAYYITPIESKDIRIINEYVADYLNTTNTFKMAYTFSKNHLSNPDEIEYFYVDWRGFPFNDSVTITLSD